MGIPKLIPNSGKMNSLMKAMRSATVPGSPVACGTNTCPTQEALLDGPLLIALAWTGAELNPMSAPQVTSSLGPSQN
jgi:hypothetical protein